MNIGYKRVSSADQNPGRQLVGIDIDKEFIDYASGATKDRPQLELCLLTLRDGDTLHVHSVDRLARSLVDAVSIIQQVLCVGATIIIYSPHLRFSGDKSDPYATFQLQLFASIAELERSMIRQRQAEGTARAKAHGTRSGKPWGKPPLDMSLAPQAEALYKQGRSIRSIASEMSLSRSSITKLLRSTNTTLYSHPYRNNNFENT
jgi:DNA invertase Pin-like site-specific DNA recombinase